MVTVTSIKKLRHAFILSGICFLLLAFGCAEVPITQRQSLSIVPQSELLTMSLQQYDDVLKKSKLSTDPEKTAMIQKVGQRVARATEAFLREAGLGHQVQNYAWEFALIEDDKTVNAWCMPGGKVAVYTGILPYTKDETGLAVVMGHEIAHAIANHGNERMSQGLLAELGGMALSVALASKPQETRQLFMTVFGVGTDIGFLLPYSRLHENEADRIGLILMARAGYDPREAIPFWERMNKDEKSRPPEFLSTHPAPDSRIDSIRANMAEALPYYEKAVK